MSWLIYLLEVACCHFLFWLVYRLLFHKLSSFQWNRVYLVATVLISFFIPVLEIPIYNAVDSPELYTWDWSESTNEVSHSSESVESSINWYAVIPMMILLIYLVGVLYFIIRIILSMSKVLRLIRNNEVDMKSGVQLIRIPQNTRFFSFGKWIFVSSLQAIDEQSQALILSHEKAHVDHKHTYDLILMELVSAFCWFNPFIYFIKSDLRLIHEYQADEATMSLSSDVDQYSRLMLSLACRSTSQGITHSFSKQNLKKRIMMINTQKSNAQSLWRYALVVPIVTLLLAVFSFTSVQLSPQKETGPKIRKVQWSGNTIFTDAQLNEVLGFEPGDFYDEEYFNNALNLNPNGPDISSLFMDRGHLFFSIEPDLVEVENGVVDLHLKIYEGPTVKVSSLCVLGNMEDFDANYVMSFIDVKYGLFNRSELISSQRKLNEAGIKAVPTPEPYQEGEEWFVKIEFVVE